MFKLDLAKLHQKHTSTAGCVPKKGGDSEVYSSNRLNTKRGSQNGVGVVELDSAVKKVKMSIGESVRNKPNP